MDQYIGKILDNRYEIMERIGAGGMAVVYKAKCHRLNRLVAIKILKSDLAQDDDFRRRFSAESQAVAQLSHPNIMSVYDVSRGGDIEYIVMELLDGITLKQYMEKRGQLNWRESLHFITQIMRGLSHAHSRGIVHRDIKPQNIMVLRDGSVKVADFGIACLQNANQTLTQEALGSVHYISPEQARGDRTDPRSDIYSSGVVLYEMLTGRLPFEGDSAVSVAIQHLSAIPLAPREINPDIPEQMELICMKAMASELDKRYLSADDMIRDLEAFRKNPGISLDFDLEDLRPDETDEPTRPIRIAGAGHGHHTSTRKSMAASRDYEDEEGDDDDLPPRSGRKQLLTTVLLIIAAILALALVAVGFRSILGSFESTPVEQYVVPDIVGLTVEQAQQHADIRDIFVLEEAGSEFSDKYPEGQIVRQEPAEGEFRKGDNRTIKVWISVGEDIGQMVDLSKMSIPQAKVKMRALIEQYQLELVVPTEEEYIFHDEIQAGFIVDTRPAAGETLKKGDQVKLIVSKGPEFQTTVVPLFVDQNIDLIFPQLAGHKLTCDAIADIELVENASPEGTILWQSLEPTSEVKEGTVIKFRVSSGLISQDGRSESYMLPLDGREFAFVEVYVGDEAEPQFSQKVNCSMEYVQVWLNGSGNQWISVYIDGEYDDGQSHYLDFG